MAGVAETLGGQGLGFEGYRTLGWRGAVLAKEDPLEKVDICRWDLHMSCG